MVVYDLHLFACSCGILATLGCCSKFVVKCIWMRARRYFAPAGKVKEYEGGLQDVVVVGAGISGLVTAQAFVAEHADTVRK